MIDTHTHLYMPEYDGEINEVMNRCVQSGVSHFILPNVDQESISQLRKFHAAYPDISSMAMGLHPTEVKEDWEKVLEIIEREIKTGDYIAVGEIGMDLYWDIKFRQEQQLAFEQQLMLAQQNNLPVIIHSREALKEILVVIEKIKPKVPLIFHSFTGDVNDVLRIREVCDPYFGINGVVTYKNAPNLRAALSEISINKILLETDSPYLSPVPHRGKKNESSFLIHIKDKIAETLNISSQEVEKITDKNARQIFRI